jgi:hypothetical protein
MKYLCESRPQGVTQFDTKSHFAKPRKQYEHR